MPDAFRIAACALVAAAAASAGCSSTAPATMPADASLALADGKFPADFHVDVTVLRGDGAPELLPVQDRSAKYILLPDGSLHADASQFVDVSTRPGRTRWLYEDQVQFVWSLCSQLGFLDRSRANGPGNPDLLVAGRGERLVILTFRAEGETWTYVRRARGDEPIDPAAGRLVRALAVLGWVADLRAEQLRPERYDYGPDPYAAYRAIRDRNTPALAR